tara:strand:+ start:569 stop:829 length:261 start_codon:yes stop_codon:yes gene_type:complete
MPEFVYTVETNYFGEPRLLGVYESSTTEGALTAVQHLMEATPDPGDEWRIKFLSIRTAKEEKASLGRCRARRALDAALPEDEPVES